MADVKAAVDFTILQEDQKLEGKITNSTGGRRGLTLGAHRTWPRELRHRRARQFALYP
jgi:hypothetical protein